MHSTPAAIDDVVGACDHALGGEVERLLRRAALAVDRRRRDGLGEAGREDGVAADVHGLITDLHDTAHDHVVDECRVEVVAGDERFQHLGREVGGMPGGKFAVSLATWSADSVDDDGGSHGRHVTGGPPAGRAALRSAGSRCRSRVARTAGRGRLRARRRAPPLRCGCGTGAFPASPGGSLLPSR